MNINNTFKKIIDNTSKLETKLGNPMACFLERQEREEKEKKANMHAKSKKN